MARSEPLPNQKRSIKHKKLIIVASVAILALVVLFAPIIPTQHAVTKTRTRKIHYTSEVYGQTIGYFIPKYVEVKNTDTVGGTFSITMNKWYNPPLGQRQLEDTSTQSSSIAAKTTHAFYLPDNWIILPAMYSFTYSVTAPSTQETYQATETEYKSLLNLIENALRT
jgi:uncharacterized membrane protein